VIRHVAFVVALLAAGQSEGRKKLALLIGIDEYERAGDMSGIGLQPQHGDAVS